MTLLIVANVWPEPRSSAAGAHIMQLITVFLETEYTIHFACTASYSFNSVDLDSMGIHTSVIKINDSGVDEFISELDPEVVVFDRFMTEEQFGWRITEYCPSSLRILNTEDLHSLRKGRQDALKSGEDFTALLTVKS